MISRRKIISIFVASLITISVLYNSYIAEESIDFESFNYYLKLNNFKKFGNGRHDQNSGGADNNPSKDHLIAVKKAAVASDVPYCSTLGTKILQNGGSAVDAAVTVALCIGSINSFSSGIGGGGFMVVRHPNGTSKTFNFREMAPGKSNKDMYGNDHWKAQIGGLAIGIPGELKGLDEAFKRYTSGKLSWKDLIDPVIDLNRVGFTVDYPLEKAVNISKPGLVKNLNDWSFLYTSDSCQLQSINGGFKNNSSEFRKCVENSKDKRLIHVGDHVWRPNYAHTLEIIANNGSSEIFYDPNGPIVPKLVKTIQATGGIITPEDFSVYSADIKDSLKTTYKGKEVVTCSNPCSGEALIFGLNILDGFRDKYAIEGDYASISTQRLVEAMKWAYAGRTELGDPTDVNNSVQINKIISLEYAAEARANISDYYTNDWESYHPSYENEDDHGTAHFSILDENGMAVSMTTTVNLLFGAMVHDVSTGIILNSQMDDFSLPNVSNAFDLRPSIYNYVKPYKRPLSSCIPVIVSDGETGETELVLGAAGGSRIPSAILQAIVRTYDYGLPLLETIAYPRLHHQLLPETAYFEFGASQKVVAQLEKKGHDVELWVPRTAMNGILKREGEIHAVCDWWRKRGRADGY